MTNTLNTNDPLYAYNTYGYTAVNEGNTGTNYNTEGAQVTGASFTNNQFLSEPESLSGYQARTIDPVASSLGGATGTAFAGTTTTYIAALQVLDPFLNKKVTVSIKTSASATLALALYNFAGTQLATVTGVAMTSSIAPVTGTWGTSVVLSSGTYYVAMTESAITTTVQSVTLSVEQALLAQATTFAANVLNWRFFTAATTAGTVPASLTGTIAGATIGWFVGLS